MYHTFIVALGPPGFDRLQKKEAFLRENNCIIRTPDTKRTWWQDGKSQGRNILSPRDKLPTITNARRRRRIFNNYIMSAAHAGEENPQSRVESGAQTVRSGSFFPLITSPLILSRDRERNFHLGSCDRRLLSFSLPLRRPPPRALLAEIKWRFLITLGMRAKNGDGRYVFLLIN